MNLNVPLQSLYIKAVEIRYICRETAQSVTSANQAFNKLWIDVSGGNRLYRRGYGPPVDQ